MRWVFYAYTALSLSLGILAALGRGPVPREAALVLFAGYVLLVGASVALPRLRVFTDAISRGPAGARGVALTFDDGPHPEHTRRVMDVLEARGARGTFFLIGQKAELFPEVAREIVARGHAVGCHGYAHPRLYALASPAALAADQNHAERVFEKLFGCKPRLFRPPVGLVNPRIGRLIAERDMLHVHWTRKGMDGVASAKPERVARRVIPALRAGAIILLHDAAERGDRVPASIDALPSILDAMRALNLTGVTVPALLDRGPG